MKKRTSDISEEDFNHLINHARTFKLISEEILAWHGINTSTELSLVFPSEYELERMRKNNSELTEEQYNSFCKTIEDKKRYIIEARIEMEKIQKELVAYDLEYPIHYDEHGYPYRNMIDYDGLKYRSYETR